MPCRGAGGMPLGCREVCREVGGGRRDPHNASKRGWGRQYLDKRRVEGGKSGGGDGASRPRATRQGPSEESKAGERQQWRMRGGTARPAQTGTLQRWGLPAREAPPQSGLLVCGHTNGREREGSGVGAATCWTTLSFEG